MSDDKRKPIGNIYDPNFVSPEVTTSLQDNPVDFRTDKKTKPIGNIYDPDFKMPDRRIDFTKNPANVEGENPLASTPELSENEVSDEPIVTSFERAKASIGVIDSQIAQDQSLEIELRGELNKRRNFKDTISGDRKDVKEHLNQVIKNLNNLRLEKNKLIEENIDTADIDTQIEWLLSELDEITSEENTLSINAANRYSASSINLPSNLDPWGNVSPAGKPPKVRSIDELRLDKAKIQNKLGELRNKRKQFEYSATERSPEEKQEILTNTGSISGNIKDFDIASKYSQSTRNQVVKEYLYNGFADIAKKNIEVFKERGDYRHLMSAESLIYGEHPSPTMEDFDKTENIYKQLQRNEAFRKAGFIEKRAEAEKGLKQYFSTIEDPEERKQMVAKYTPLIAARMSINTDGQVSMHGLQLFAEYNHRELTSRKMDLDSQRKAFPMQGEDRAAMSAKYGGEDNLRKYEKDLDQELHMINQALDYTNQIMKIDLNNSAEFSLFGKDYTSKALGNIQAGMTSQSLTHLLDAGILEMAQAFNLKEIAKRSETGEITWAESKVFEMYTMMNQANGSKEIMPGFKIGKGVADMIPYIASFAASNPLYAFTKSATGAGLKAVSKVAGRAAPRSIMTATKYELPKNLAKIYGSSVISAPEVAATTLSRITGAAAQTLVQPMLHTGLATAELPKITLTFDNPEYNNTFMRIEQNTSEGKKEGKRNAYYETFAEIFTERMGGYLMKGMKLPKALNNPEGAMKHYVLSKYIDLKKLSSPGKSVEKIIKKNLGWHGIAEEYSEELANYFMTRTMTGNQEVDPNFWEQQLQTLATVALFGSAMKAVDVSQWDQVFYGDKVRYSYTDEKGKEKKVVLSRALNDNLKEIFNTEGDHFTAVAQLLTANRESLTHDQVKLIASLSAKESVNKKIKEVNKQSDLKKESIVDQAEAQAYEAEETAKPEVAKPVEIVTEGSTKENAELKVSETEKKDIDAHNKQIMEAHPELARDGLLITLPGGQLEVPTYDELLDRVDEITTHLKDISEKDPTGGFILSSPDILEYYKQLNTLQNEINKRADTEGVPFKHMFPTEKHNRLEVSLNEGKELKGRLTIRGGAVYRLQLEDGKVVNAYAFPGTPEAKKRLKEAVEQEASVKLKLDHDSGKIFVMSGNSKLATLENNDEQHLNSLKEKRVEIEEFISSEWEQIRRIVKAPRSVAYSGIPINTEKINLILPRLARIVKRSIDLGFNDLSTIVEHIKNYIRKNRRMEMGEKKYWLDFINNNIKFIQETMQKYFKEQEEMFDSDNFEAPEMIISDAGFQTGAQKVQANLETFNPIWKAVAQASKTSRDKVEKAFFQIAKMPEYDMVSDEATFQTFLESLPAEDLMMSTLLLYISSRPFPEMISVFNFYRNADLLKQYSMLIRKDGSLRFDQLNQPQLFDEFVDSYYNTIRDYKWAYVDEKGKVGKVYYGYEAVRARLSDHHQKARQRQIKIMDLGSEERTNLRRQQFEDDLELLSEITGIPTNTWKEFFKKQTGETTFALVKGSKRKQTFNSYEDILTKDLWVGNYPRIQSNIVHNLQDLIRLSKNLDEFKSKLDNFFTIGDNSRKVLANLYRLSTSLENKDDVSLSGIDTKGDRFSSFVQFSHGMVEAQRQGRELTILNGIINLEANPGQKGITSQKMSVEDIWFSLIFAFTEGTNSYQQHMGQFADKSTIILIDSTKHEASEEDITQLEERFPDFKEAVDYVYNEIIIPNKEKLVPPSTQGFEQKRKDLAVQFVYNYAVNMEDIIREFHGDISEYKDGLIGLMKRGGSTISPGYRLNTKIKNGVGSEYRVLLVNDKIFNGHEVADGFSLYSEDTVERMSVSMGDIYNRKHPTEKNPAGYPILDSIKGVHSSVNKETGKRGLDKTNGVNIEAFEKLNSPVYKKLKKLMADHHIDKITFTSGNKQSEDEVIPFELFDAEGKVNPSSKITDLNILTRSWEDFYVQQDLRHPNTPKASKMASQQLTNILYLNNGIEISNLIKTIQAIALAELEELMGETSTDEIRLKWIKENISEYSQPDIYRMIQAGVHFNEPSIKTYLRNLIANHVSKNALDVMINRVSTQEIPDIDGRLEGRRSITIEGKERILLPDIAANMAGVRAHWYEFKGKPAEAIAYVKEHLDEYPDLLDSDGRLMEWEITGRNGVIPGEPVISTRIPASGLNSHTVARLALNLPVGNFTMLDRESQRISGSDFDGDARYNQIFFKKKGKVVDDNSKEGLANKILMEMVWGYQDPSMSDQITTPIDTNAYKSIVEPLKETLKDYNPLDIRSYIRGWNQNKVGVDMKAIMTNINTMFSIASAYGVQLKIQGNAIGVEKPWDKQMLTGFVSDEFGQMKRHIYNLQNMAFDNGKNPQIELMGLNEITVNMWMLAIMTDPTLSSDHFDTAQEHYDAIYAAIEKQVEYFTSPMVQKFISLARKQNGGLVKKDRDSVWRILEEKFPKDEIKKLKKFARVSSELTAIKELYNLVQDVPHSAQEFMSAEELVQKFKNNSFTLFDTGQFFFTNKGGSHFRMEFEIVPKILDFMKKHIYYDAVELTSVGNNIYNFIFDLLDEKYRQEYNIPEDKPGLKSLTKTQVANISSIMNNVLAVRALNKEQSFEEVKSEVISQFNQLKVKENSFKNKLHVKSTEYGPVLELIPEFHQATFSETQIAEIHKDYDKLPNDFRQALKKYVFHQFGTSPSRYTGSPYSLMSDSQKIGISYEVQEELNDWVSGILTSEEQYQIAQFIIHSTKDSGIKSLWQEGEKYALHNDINAQKDPFPVDLDSDSLEALTEVPDVSAFMNWNEEYGIEDPLAFWTNILNVPVKTISLSTHIKPWAKRILATKRRIEYYFPRIDEQVDEDELKSMLAEDSIGEAFATDDPDIQKFILTHLQQMYPDVAFFSNRELFFEFIRKNGARGLKISPTAIGHALGNAAWVDPENAVQSSVLHEYAHIYWDALPADHYAKTQLIRLFSERYPDLLEDQVEEQIILAIGRSAFGIAKSRLNPSMIDKFAALLKKFWTAVKRLFEKYSSTDLVNEMAEALWTNRDKIKPQTITGRSVLKNMAVPSAPLWSENQDDGLYFIENAVYQRVSNITQYAKVTPFDNDGAVARAIRKIQQDYYDQNGFYMDPAQEIIKTYEIQSKWETSRRAGEMTHKIASMVFGGEVVNPSLVSEVFETNEAYRILVDSFQNFRSEFLKRYPGATFETEVITNSKKFKVAGTINVRARLTDGKHIIIAFKTSKNAYKDSNGGFTYEYTRPNTKTGLKPPYPASMPDSKEVEHSIQMNAYMAMEEEQGNEVVGCLIVPVQKEENDKGQLVYAKIFSRAEKIWNNLVFITPTKEGKARVYGLMDNFKKEKKLSPLPSKAKVEALIANKIDREVAKAMVAAEEYLSRGFNLDKITNVNVENIAGWGLASVIQKLNELGYGLRDLYGTTAIETKYLFYIADHGIKKSDYELNKSAYINNRTEVGHTYKDKKNKDHVDGVTKYFVDAGPGYYLEESGHGTLEIGDQIAKVVAVGYEEGTPEYKVYLYTVNNIDKKNRKVFAIDQLTGTKTIMINNNDPKAGIMKLIPEDPTIKNAYNPVYISEKQTIYEARWKRLTKDDIKNPEELEHYLEKIPIIDKFFEDNKTLEDVRKALNNAPVMEEFFNKFKHMTDRHFSWFQDLVAGTLTSHWVSVQIRDEAENMRSNEIKPFTLNLYYLLNANEDNKKSMFNFQGSAKGFAKHLMTDGMFSGKYIPFHFLISGVREAYGEAMTATIALRSITDDYLGKVDQSKITMFFGETQYYKKPSDRSLSKTEKEFLEIIYDHHYTYDQRFKILDKVKGEYPRLIPVTQMFATTGELVKQFGPQNGRLIGELLSPKEYDDMEIDEVYWHGKGFKKKWETTGAKTTLRKVKEDFVYEHGNPAHNRFWLGTYLREGMSFLSFVNPGLLRYYNRRAADAYDAIKHTNPHIRAQRSNIPITGRSVQKYSSNFFNEASVKVIEGLIYDHYMKPLIAPVHEILSMAQARTDVTEWVREYSDIVIFRRRPERGVVKEQMNRQVKKALDYLVRINSLNKIAHQYRVQFKNLAIGYGMNITREPEALRIGLTRMFSSVFKEGNHDFSKIMNLIKKENRILNLIDDSKFNELDRMLMTPGKTKSGKPLTVFQSLVEKGYKPMEFFEKIIQVPLVIGMLTRDELNAYDQEGNLIDKPNQITYARWSDIAERIKNVHGHYGPINANPTWMTYWGAALAQFRKWGPAVFNREFAEYHIDKHYQIRGGVAATLNLLIQMTSWNLQSKDERKIEYDLLQSKQLKKKKGKEKELTLYDETFFQKATEYLNRLIIAKEGGRITMKDLNKNDINNLYSLINQLGLALAVLIMNLLIFGGGDDDEIDQVLSKKQFILRKMAAKFFMRYNSELYFFASPEQYTSILKDPVPATSIIVNTIQFGTEFIAWMDGVAEDSHVLNPNRRDFRSSKGVYEKDTPFAKEGWPKWILRSTYLMPMGSQIRDFIKFGIFLDNYGIPPFKEVDFENILRELDVPESEIAKIQETYAIEPRTKSEIKAYLEKYRTHAQALEIGAIVLDAEQRLLSSGVELEEMSIDTKEERYELIYSFMQSDEYKKSLVKDARDLGEAEKMETMIEARENGLMTEEENITYEALLDAAKEIKKIEEKKGIRTNRYRKKEYKKNQDILESIK